jgi:hypothetical protein
MLKQNLSLTAYHRAGDSAHNAFPRETTMIGFVTSPLKVLL